MAGMCIAKNISAMGDMNMTAPVATAVEHGRQIAQNYTPCNVYRDVFGAWRWEFRDAHGEMCDSLDSFDTYQECVTAAQRAGLVPQG